MIPLATPGIETQAPPGVAELLAAWAPNLIGVLVLLVLLALFWLRGRG